MTDDATAAPRLHVAAQIEDRIAGVVEGQLRGRGWTPRLVPYIGYGSAPRKDEPGWVRILARVVLLPPDWMYGGTNQPSGDQRGWRRFLTRAASGVDVRIRVGERTHHVRSGRDGYLDVRVPSDLEAGWRTAILSVEGLDDPVPVAARLRVVGEHTRLGLISDIDDTVIVTMLPQPLVAFRNAFLLRESSRRPVEGMPEFYRAVVDAHPDVFVVYLSTGAFNIASALNAFLGRYGYPPGPLLLTDWGPTQDAWFRSGQQHKRTQLRRLFEELPQLQWLLVGDDGQHDPELYAEAQAEHPDKVAAVAIRQLTLTQQVVGHGNPVPKDLPLLGRELPGNPVAAPTGDGLAHGLRELGLLPWGTA